MQARNDPSSIPWEVTSNGVVLLHVKLVQTYIQLRGEMRCLQKKLGNLLLSLLSSH
jgi:hypothetical protein